MRTTEGRRSRTSVLAIAMIVAGLGGVLVSGNPAAADVDSVAGSATPLFIGGSPVVPTVSGSAAEPTDSYGPIGSGLLSSGPCPGAPTPGPAPIPLVISLGLLTACTQGAGVAGENHLGFAESSASVADVVLGATELGVVTSQCRADGNGARGSSAIVGPSGLPTNPPANFSPTGALPTGVLSIILNEQIVTNTPGTATITVNAVHVNILGIDIILAQSTCSAFGPDVNVTTTTSTTAPATTTTTTGATTTTTTAATTTTTRATTTTTIAATTTTTAQAPPVIVPVTITVPVAVQQPTALAKTGAAVQPLAMLSAVSFVLGLLLLVGSNRPLRAVPASASASYRSGVPERWGPAEILKTIWAAVAALLLSGTRLFGRRRRRG